MSAEQITLADSIKKVHQDLRRDVQQMPEAAESIWNAHIADTEKLTTYAQSMRQLAEEHWAAKVHGQTRLSWCYDTVRDYFCTEGVNGLARRRARDQRKQTPTEICPSCEQRIPRGIPKPRLLDVGSCYNGFSVYDDLETLAIDIAPADESVHRIDFLQTPQPPLICQHSFDAVVFCLMLDYLPTCRQRLSACLIANQLLTCFGLLLIIEPDSSLRRDHQKNWREALQSVGFALVSSTKMVNLHCMAYRKMLASKEMDEADKERLSQLLSIPQDTMIVDEQSEHNPQTSISVDQDLFDELPLGFD